MKSLNIYQQLQIGLVLLLVMLFSGYVVLDVIHYALSEFARNALASIWSIILLLISPEQLKALIQSKADATPPATTGAEGFARLRLLLALAALSLLLLLAGCATATITTKTVDGKVVECSGTYLSLFRDLDSVTLSACGGRGGSTGAKINTQVADLLLKALVAVP